MGKVIQMIKTSEDNSLFIYGLNDKEELIFRASRNPAQLQNEKIVIEKGMVYTNLYFFPVLFLEKVINENKEL